MTLVVKCHLCTRPDGDPTLDFVTCIHVACCRAFDFDELLFEAGFPSHI